MAMKIQPGRVGNLTDDQESKLKEMWGQTLNIFGITQDESGSNSADSGYASIQTRADDGNDKHGQTKAYEEILRTQTPEAIRAACWSMVKHDNPDELLLRFLRARKWDVNAAVIMFMSTMQWRMETMHVDDDIMLNGEGLALKQSAGTDLTAKKHADGFMAQLRTGKAYLHGTDKEGRPCVYIRVRIHHKSEQTEEALERFIIYFIETSRMLLKPPVDTATIVFDMTGFSLSNMDYTPVKLIIKCFEANYPESLGNVLIYKSPWIFQGIWRIIRGWLDPVVASKVHFAGSIKELGNYIDSDKILKEQGGPDTWNYEYTEPPAGEDENACMKDTAARDTLNAELKTIGEKYEAETLAWIHDKNDGAERQQLAKQWRDTYWKIDPYLRARSVYDRNGVIQDSQGLPKTSPAVAA